MTLMVADMSSPLGPIRVAATEEGLCAVDFLDRWERVERQLERRFGALEYEPDDDPHGAVAALGRYFAGDLDALDDLPVDPGGTDFQRAVWDELRRIPTGHTRSYAALARAIGRETGSRAVGAANGRNPVAIVVPCHRVIGSGGDLCGYAGGVDRKRWLLAHEGALLPVG